MMREVPRGRVIDVAARPKLNHWRGRTSMELEIIDIRVPTPVQR
jgi:hypothetical protein